MPIKGPYEMVDYIGVRPGGITKKADGNFDCGKQGGKIVGIAFSNDGNQNVQVEFGGAQILLIPGRQFTHFTNYPYVNEQVYYWKFLATPVAAAATKTLNIYFDKTIEP